MKPVIFKHLLDMWMEMADAKIRHAISITGEDTQSEQKEITAQEHVEMSRCVHCLKQFIVID